MEHMILSDLPEETKLYPRVMKAQSELIDIQEGFYEKYATTGIEEYTEEDKTKLRKCAKLLNDFKERFKEELL